MIILAPRIKYRVEVYTDPNPSFGKVKCNAAGMAA